MNDAPWRPARHVEADHLAIEPLRRRDVADPQMDVADAQPAGRRQVSVPPALH